MAAFRGHQKVVDLLLQNNADVNAKDLEGFTALVMAAKYGHIDIVKLLLQNNVDVNERGVNICSQQLNPFSEHQNSSLRTKEKTKKRFQEMPLGLCWASKI